MYYEMMFEGVGKITNDFLKYYKGRIFELLHSTHIPTLANCWHACHKGRAEKKRMDVTRKIYLKEIICDNKSVAGEDILL